MSQRFGRKKRLLNAQQFKAVFDSPDCRSSGRCMLLLACNNPLKHPRLGLVIGKKNVKLAIERNRIKRQIRESFRKQQLDLPCVDLVVIARKGLSDLSNDELAQELERFWKRLLRQCNAQDKKPEATAKGSQDAQAGHLTH